MEVQSDAYVFIYASEINDQSRISLLLIVHLMGDDQDPGKTEERE